MWDERYATPEYAYGTEPNTFLASVAAQIPRGRVLSLADGEGRNGVFLASLGHTVTTVDASPVGVAKALRLAESRGVELTALVKDLNDWTIPPAAWEGIVSIFCHLPPALRRRVHAGVVEGLVPGGIFVLESYAVRQLEFGTGGPSSAAMLLTPELVREELRGLEYLHLEELERDVQEGTFHRGRSAVVQVVARKPEKI